MKRVLFVCTGNICRSPTAEGVFRHLIEEAGLAHAIESASAGTHGYHVGDPPDPRTIAAARRRGFDLSSQRARKVRIEDFHVYDLILAMDSDHLAHLESLRPNDSRAEIRLFLAYHPDIGHRDVPDPYYGGPEGFEQVLEMIEHATRALLRQVSAGLTSR